MTNSAQTVEWARLLYSTRLILQSVVRPPAFTLKATSPSLCCLLSICSVPRLLCAIQGKRVEPCRCSFKRAKPSSASHDPTDLVAPQSISAHPVSSASLLRACPFLCERPWLILRTPNELSLLTLSSLVSLAFQDTVKPSADRCR